MDILGNAEADLTSQMRNLIDMRWGEWKTVERQIEELTDRLEQISASEAGCGPFARFLASGQQLRLLRGIAL